MFKSSQESYMTDDLLNLSIRFLTKQALCKASFTIDFCC